MPTCKNCGKSGFFVVVSSNGLCEKCDPPFVMELQNRFRIYNDSIRLIENSENPEVVYSRIQLAIEILNFLLQYEKRGIPTFKPPPSTSLEVFRNESDNFLFDCFVRAKKKLDVKVFNQKSVSSKRNYIQNFINKIDEYHIKVNVNVNERFKELRKECEKQLNNYDFESGQNPKLVSNPSKTTINGIAIKEIHSAKLLFIEKTSKGHNAIKSGIRISIRMGGGNQNETLGLEEPSTIFQDLFVTKPLTPSNVDPPHYYPTYSGLSPEQKWIYLNWLDDISEQIDIGYVFLYYYGLERHLLTGDFKTAYNEILFLRKFHSNNSFESYSYNALLFSTVFRNQIDLAKSIMESESKNGIDNVDLMFNYRFENGIVANQFMTIAKRIKGVNQRYIKALPDRYAAALRIVLSDKYGIDEFPIYSLYHIEEIPRQQTIAFANISFPSTMRTPSLPNFFNHLPFLLECSEVFNNAHELVKKDLGREHLIQGITFTLIHIHNNYFNFFFVN